MSIVEKNDVDINKLFHWGKKFEIVNEDGTVALETYIRLLGDSDVNRAKVYALRRSSEIRRKLREEGSDERLAFLYDPDNMEKERLIALISGLSLRQITQDVIRNTKIKYPKQPKSDATLEEQEKYQKAVDDFEPKREKEIKKAIEKEVEAIREELETLPRSELLKRYENSMIDELCEQEALLAFKEMSAYLGSFADEDYKELLFEDFAQFQNLPTEIKKQFIDNHQALEMTHDELKKLRQATQ